MHVVRNERTSRVMRSDLDIEDDERDGVEKQRHGQRHFERSREVYADDEPQRKPRQLPFGYAS